MLEEIVQIAADSPNIHYQLHALKFGPTAVDDQAAPKKVYLQASLHGDEMPGSLVAYYLHQALLTLEQENQLKAQIILVPFCNPIGAGQYVNYKHIGRFHLTTGQNFNRLQAVDLYSGLKQRIAADTWQWSTEPTQNVQKIRNALLEIVSQTQASNAVNAMHLQLLKWSCDADIVFDMHCDIEAVLHIYTTPNSWPVFEPLARLLRSQCQLIGEDSGCASFDEVLSVLWLRLQQDYPELDLPQACHSATVEFRSNHDLSHEWAQQDAQAIIDYLRIQGCIGSSEAAATAAAPAIAELPALLTPPHPLTGLCYVNATAQGIVVYHVKPGDWVEPDQALADIMNPMTLQKTTVYSPAAGIVFARGGQTLVNPHIKLLSISCPEPVGNGQLSP
ncbi:succinylglutamate desuccinylase/aspartoacylase family protein [Brackiella oedipodis]|uniref:succinylglutamate desuccinylase/aspartoacylase family protein n=1 Tax=Brackiella oedipodis TaxID=124225 RepID=UPI00048C8AFE|nr:succinylglutamate desuccinylase/aspartoacylase family protein [Brackiella oedipodis]